MRVLMASALALALLVAGAGIALAVTQETDEVAADIWISAAPPEVWRVLTTTAAFPAWNPFIRRLEGDLVAGRRITIQLGDGDDATSFHPQLLAVAPERELRWRGGFWPGGLFDGEHSFVMAPDGPGTRFVQSERFSGLLVGPLTRGVIAEAGQWFAAMNQALKARVEGRR